MLGMGEPARAWPAEEDLDDGPLTPAEEAALVAAVDEARAEGGESIPYEVARRELGRVDED